jgi:hypothetical protein
MEKVLAVGGTDGADQDHSRAGPCCRDRLISTLAAVLM